MSRRKFKLDVTVHSASDRADYDQIENYVNNVKEQIMNTTQHNDSDSVWQECYDESSGCAYYWNTQTNIVQWEKPEHYEAHTVMNQDASNKTKNARKRLSNECLPTLDVSSCNGPKKSKLESKPIGALVAYGSDSSDGENEDEEDKKSSILQRLQRKAEMFKQKELDELAAVVKNKSPGSLQSDGQPDILDIIGEEVPPDYEVGNLDVSADQKQSSGDIFDILKNEVPPDYVDDTTDNRSEEDSEKTVVEVESELPSEVNGVALAEREHFNDTDEKTNATNLESSKEISLTSFSLISTYDEEDSEDSDDSKCDLKETTISYAQDPCANTKTGFGYSISSKQKNGSSISFVKGETIHLQNSQKSDKNNVLLEKDTVKNSDNKNDKNHIQDLSLLISSKLHFLADCENNDKLSSVQIMTVKIDTLMEAWKVSCLNDEYFSKWLDEMAIDLSSLEESVAPDGWTCQWDKINTRYYYQNVVDGRTQWQYPLEESECASSPGLSKTSTTPPHPNTSDLNNSLLYNQPIDMDIEDDILREDTEIIVPPVPGDELSHELNSFYADLAQFESKPSGQIETMIAVPTPETPETVSKVNGTVNRVKNSCEEEKEIVKPKKKKKVGKLDMGLGLKHKNVSTLVQKWQQIQNEIK